MLALTKTAEMNQEKERVKTLEQFDTELSFAAIARKIENVIATINK